jgi:CRP/FNR family transcriptional regulator, cyclic AMP receptor protein
LGSEADTYEQQIVIGAFACTAPVASHILAQSRIKSHPGRATILRAGDDANAVHLMLIGDARAIALAFDGRLVLVQEYHQGDLFGEGALLGNVQHDEDVIALTQVKAAQFTAFDFIGLMESHSAVALAVSRVLTQRLSTARRRLVEGATLSSNGRIYAELLRQARANGSNTISPAPVLSDFALKVQTARETVSRAISLLEKRGIIRRTADALVIVAPHRLEELIV